MKDDLANAAMVAEPEQSRLRSVELKARLVEKPWGRTELPSGFFATHGRRIGEVWFEHPAEHDLPLLAKYIFTSEKLSVQVHPDEEQARMRGLGRGKNECWYILDAPDGAAIGLGLVRQLSRAELRAAARDGSIDDLVAWRPVAAGDFISVPAGTVHSIGAGISLLEFEQNADVTYRLYDYGRARSLHVDEGVAVSHLGHNSDRRFRPAGGPANCTLLDGPRFSLVRASSAGHIPDSLLGRRRWVLPIAGTASADGVSVSAGGCLLAERGAPLSLSSAAIVLVGAEGSL